jgi:hypothetical protein
MRWWTAVVLLTAVAAAVWTVVMKSAAFGPYYAPKEPYSRGQAVIEVFQRWGGWLDQAVAVFNWLALRVPEPIYVFWEIAAGTLLVLALALGGWVERWRLLVVFAGAVLLPGVLQVWYVNENGFITQGRYLLPILAGLVLLAAFVLDEHGFPERAAASLTRLILLVVIPIQVFCFVFMMARWQHGLPDYGKLGPSSLNPFTGSWHPPVGSVLPLFLALAGLGVVSVIAWVAARPAAEPSGDQPGLVYARRMGEHSEVYQ